MCKRHIRGKAYEEQRDREKKEAWQAFRSHCRSKTCERKGGGKDPVGSLRRRHSSESLSQDRLLEEPHQAGMAGLQDPHLAQHLAGSSPGKLDFKKQSYRTAATGAQSTMLPTTAYPRQNLNGTLHDHTQYCMISFMRGSGTGKTKPW